MHRHDPDEPGIYRIVVCRNDRAHSVCVTTPSAIEDDKRFTVFNGIECAMLTGCICILGNQVIAAKIVGLTERVG